MYNIVIPINSSIADRISENISIVREYLSDLRLGNIFLRSHPGENTFKLKVKLKYNIQ